MELVWSLQTNSTRFKPFVHRHSELFVWNVESIKKIGGTSVMKFHLFIYRGYQGLLLQHLFSVLNYNTLEVASNLLTSEIVNYAVSHLNLHILDSSSAFSNKLKAIEIH